MSTSWGGYLFSFLGSKYLKMELLYRMGNACMHMIQETTKPLQTALPFCIPSGNLWECQSLYILDIWYFQSF